MNSKEVYAPFILEKRILHVLMLNTFSVANIGLMSGKTGILVGLATYNQLKQNAVYDDFIDELMDEILSKIHNELSFGFGNGLCGIAWGIEFLIQKGIMEGRGVDICEEIDKKIMETDPHRIVDMTLDTGMEGLLHYILAHIKGSFLQQSTLPFDERYRADLFQALQICSHKKVSEEMQKLIVAYIHFYNEQAIPEYELSLKEFIKPYHINERQLCDYSLGLNSGLTGLLLKIIDNVDYE